MIAYGLAYNLQIEMAYNLSGTSIDTPPEKIWVDNEGQNMRDNLGNSLYFNKAT